MITVQNVLLEHSPCPLGCNANNDVVLSGRDLLHGLPGKFTVVKCTACSLMRTDPRPTPDTIGLYYPEDYGPYIGTQVQEVKPVSRIKTLFKPFVRYVFNLNTQRLPVMAPGRMLEIGCASGAFLHQLAGGGWQVEGIEFSGKAAQTAARLGYHVHIGPLETAPKPDEPFDLIVGWMVLEHLHDPVAGLQKLSEWARPGAWLALSVPNAKSWEFRLFKDKWYALQLPTHLHHFTPETLRRVLNAGGWTLEKVHHQRVLSNLIASTGYVLWDKGYTKLGQKLISFPARAGWWNYVFYPLAWLLSVFGQTGRMTVWARVKS